MAKSFVINLGRGVETVDNSTGNTGYTHTAEDAVLKGEFTADINAGEKNGALLLNGDELLKFFAAVANKNPEDFERFNMQTVDDGFGTLLAITCGFTGGGNGDI